MMVDLRPDHLEIMKRILAGRVPEYQVRAFGSRARWTAKDTSDLDLVVMTDAPLGLARLADLQEAFSESDLPFRVDVLDWAATSVEFREITEQDYAVIQQPSSTGSSGPTWRRLGMGDDLWAEWPFPDVIDFQEGPGILAKDFRDSGVPLIRLSGLDRGVSVLKRCNFLDPATVQQRWSHFALQEGDILLSTSASLGRIAVVGKEGMDAIAYTGIIRMRPRDDRVYAPFIRYLLEGPDFQRQAEMAGVGSVIRHFGPMHLRRMTVRIPPMEEQRAIACILGALDDKIELNRRMNQTLEGIARAIFKSWFVDFDPVRAKATSQQPPGLAPHIANLFPDAFETSELGEIPKGWGEGTVGEGFNIAMGQSPPGKTYNEDGDGLPFYQGRRDFGFRYPSLRVYCTAPTRFAKPGDTLVSVRAPVGDINMTNKDCCVGRGVAAVRHKTNSRSYTYYAMKSLRMLFDQFEAEGTVFGSLNKRDFHNLPFLIPPTQVVEKFEQQVFPIDQLIETSEQQAQTLAALRDTLLPKLISGELRVPDAEKFCMEVGL